MRNLTNLLPLIVLAALFYVLLIRPQRNRQRQAQALLAKVSVGDRVMTSSGMYGTVVLVDGDDVEVEVFPDVDIRFVKGAIQRILPPEPETGELDRTDADVVDADSLDGGRDDSVAVVRPAGDAHRVSSVTGSTAGTPVTAAPDADRS